MTKQPFKKVNERADDLLGIIHTDVCGPFSHEVRGGHRYFLPLLTISVGTDMST